MIYLNLINSNIKRNIENIYLMPLFEILFKIIELILSLKYSQYQN